MNEATLQQIFDPFFTTKFLGSLVQRSLEDLGYTALLAEHGKQALDVLERSIDPISLVLLDLAMPVMDGMETAARMQQRRPDLPIIVMTGLADQDAARHLENIRISGIRAEAVHPGAAGAGRGARQATAGYLKVPGLT